jgi:hypothetical protein
MVLSCAIALGAAIWFSPGNRNLNQSEGDQAPAQVGNPALRSDSAPAASVINQTEPERNAHEPQSNLPDWILIGVTLLGFGLTWRQIQDAKQAVLLTERADVLVFGITASTYPERLSPETVMMVEFKNFGATRADQIKFTAALNYEGIVGESDNSKMPPIVLAAGDSQGIKFRPLSTCMTIDTGRRINAGETPMTVEATATYRDVFGMPHKTVCKATYDHLARSFQITEVSAS